MITLKFFRHKYFAIAMSSLFFLFSCTSNGVDTPVVKSKSLDYNTFKFFQSNSSIINDIKVDKYLSENSNSTIEMSQSILDQVNLELGTTVSYPDLALELIDYSAEEIIELSMASRWMDDLDVSLINSFMSDLENGNFDIAMNNFENTVLSLNISDEKFNTLNLMANLVQSINYENPNTFNNIQESDEHNSGWFRCALATLALASATAGLSSCATVVACGAAIALHLGAVQNFGRACLSENKAPQLNDQ